jgi:hypothetical protein
MALSGSITATSNNQYISGTLSWSATQNISGNYSDVTATLRMERTNSGYTTSGSGTWTITINGVASSVSKSVSLTYNSDTLIHTFTTRVNHNSDGTKTLTISATGGMPSTSYTSTTCSGSITLNTIPRATTVSVADTTVDMGQKVVINHDGASDSFTHKLYYTFGSLNKVLITSPGEADISTDWYPDIAIFAAQVPNATSGTCTITCETLNAGTVIGTKTCTLTLYVPASIIPTITSITATELVTNVGTVVGTGKYVKGLSNIRFAITGVTTKYGSAIKTYKINFNSADHTGSSTWDTGVLSISGTYTATATVTDNRNRTSNPVTVQVTIMNYTVPAISTFTVQRCLSDGTIAELGDYVKVVRVGTASSLINVSEKNTVSCTVKYRVRPSGAWVTASTCTVAASSSVGTAINSNYILLDINGATAGGGFNITDSYDFQFSVVDKFNTTLSNAVVPTGATVMSWGQNAVAIGKVVEEENKFDVGLPSVFRKDATLDNNTRIWAKKVSGDLLSLAYVTTTDDVVIGQSNAAVTYLNGNWLRNNNGTNTVDIWTDDLFFTDKTLYTTDFNLLLKQGKYSLSAATASSTYQNAPVTGGLYGCVIVINRLSMTGDTSNHTYQWVHAGAHTVYKRGRINGTWSAWEREVFTGSGADFTAVTLTNDGNSLILSSATHCYAQYNVNGTRIGWVGNGSTTNNDMTLFADNGAAILTSSSSIVTLTSYNGSGTSKKSLFLGNTMFAPVTGYDNTLYLGDTTRRWKQLYAATATIGTSDRNQKQQISSIDDSVLDAWSEVNYCKFKFNDAVAEKGPENARWHTGVIAQDIEAAFARYGINAFEYGLLCYDEWDDKYDDVGVLIQPKGSMYSIRADECQFLEMALQRRETEKLKQQIAALQGLQI